MANNKDNNNKSYKGFINESSLSRLWQHNDLHDCAALTAFRNAPDCGKGTPYTSKENAQRNKSLMAKLKSKGYGITKLHGTYPEGGRVGKEISYFIVDLKDTGRLEKDVMSLGEEFEQDTVLYVPRGAMAPSEKGDTPAKGYLISTNHCDNNWLSYHKKNEFKRARIGHKSKIYTSLVNGRPWIFESVGDEVRDPGNGMGFWMMHLSAEKDWREIEV